MGFRFKQVLRDRKGGVTILAAVSLLTVIASTALAVDVGNIFLAKRHLQGAADAAALYAAMADTNRDGAVKTALADNGLADKATFNVTNGSYVPAANVAAGSRFVPGGTPANSARVQVERDVPLFFAGILTQSDSMHIVASASAAKIDYAAFSIGTRLASIEGGLPNALLSGLAGTNLELSVMDYNALAQTNVNIFTFAKSLQSQLNLSGATFGETLETDITLPKAIGALADAAKGQPGADSLSRLQASVPHTTIRLADLIDLGPFSDTDRGDTSALISTDAYSLVQQMLQLGNRDRQVKLDLSAAVPGVTSTTVTLAIGQRAEHSPWLTVAKDESLIVRTSQARLYIDSQISAAKTGLLSLRAPLYVELAEASAKLKSISCTNGRSRASVSLSVLPSVGKASIADINMNTFANFSVPATERAAVIAKLPLATVTGQSSIKIGGVTWQTASFSPSEIAAGTTKTVSTGDALTGVASSLVRTMDLKATLLGIGLDASAVTSMVGSALTPVAPGLDQIVNDLTNLLGVHVGQADVRIDGVRCGRATLIG